MILPDDLALMPGKITEIIILGVIEKHLKVQSFVTVSTGS